MPPASVLPPPYTGNTQNHSRYPSQDLEMGGDPFIAHKPSAYGHAQNCIQYHEREEGKRKKGQAISLCISLVILIVIVIVVVIRNSSQNS